MARRLIEIDELISRFHKTHGEYYGYSKLNYTGMTSKIVITCPKHGDFEQYPTNHLKSGCRKCANLNESVRRGFGIEGFIHKATTVHGTRYGYESVDYQGLHTPVLIMCAEHGAFFQRPSLHLSGSGCAACGGVKPLTTDSFILRACDLHGDRYNYSSVSYINLNTRVIITCPDHGDFLQLACNHLAGNGCPRCATRYRKQDYWLDSLNVPNDRNHRQVRLPLYTGNFIVADGYMPETSTVYEFWGDRWHGNPRRFDQVEIHPVIKCSYGALYQQTLMKCSLVIASGYKLVQIWEDEWDLHIRLGTNNL